MNERMQPQGKTVGLVDVDFTLAMTVNGKTVYNSNLIGAMKKKNIFDMYLFSCMSISARDLEDRKKLIAWLTEQGMRVHGVITDTDPGTAIDCQAKEDFKVNGKSATEPLRAYLSTHYESYLGENPKPLDFPCGTAWKDAAEIENFKDTDESVRDTNTNGAVTSILVNLRGYDRDGGRKAIMFELFMSGMLSSGHPYETVVVIDDASDNLKAVEMAYKRFFADKNVTLISVNVSKTMEPQGFYENKIDPQEVLRFKQQLEYLRNAKGTSYAAIREYYNERSGFMGSFLRSDSLLMAENVIRVVEKMTAENYQNNLDIIDRLIEHFKRQSRSKELIELVEGLRADLNQPCSEQRRLKK